MANREPLGDVVQHPRKEARLRRAQQQAHHVETVRPLDKRHADGDRAPSDHDAGEPAAGTEALKHQVAGDLQQEVADKKQPGAQPVGGVTNAQVRAHVQLGETDGRAIHVSDQVQQDQEGNQFQGDAAYKPEFLAHEGGLQLFLLWNLGDRLCTLQHWQGRPSLEIDYIVLLFKPQLFQRQVFRLTLTKVNAIKSYNKSDDHV